MAGDAFLEGEERWHEAVAAAARDPRAAALFCDVDGTVSPIAPRPQDAVVPPRFRDLLRDLSARLGLVAFVSGRTLADARRMVGLDGVVYVGSHGLEVMDRDGAVRLEPLATRYREAVAEVARLAREELDVAGLGLLVEEKGLGVAVHYRLAPDPVRARHAITAVVAAAARERGLAVTSGHMVVEVRPPLPFSKGTAVERLLADGDWLTALACGDDLTDVTMFTALHRWQERDGRRHACALAAVTEETPRPVREEADVLVRATPGVYEALARLAAAVGG